MNLKMLLTVTVLLACALPPAAHAGSLTTELIGMFPRNAGEVAYADLRQARQLTWFPRLQEQMLPERFRQFEKVLTSAGMDPNSQIEELAWALVPADVTSDTTVPSGEEVVGVALGSFWPEKTEAYFKAQKLTVVNVRDYSLYALGGGLFFCFIDSNTAAFGQRKELEKLIAVRYGEEQSILNDTELAPLIMSQANGRGVVWAVLSAPYARLAMRQLAPQTAEFPQAQQLVSKLRALTLEISAAGTGIQTHFEVLYTSPDNANAFAALLQAGLLYQRYQVANSNPDLAAALSQAEVAPSGDSLDVTLPLTDDQVVGMIQLNTFANYP
jgi:hypothetical protein